MDPSLVVVERSSSRSRTLPNPRRAGAGAGAGGSGSGSGSVGLLLSCRRRRTRTRLNQKSHFFLASSGAARSSLHQGQGQGQGGRRTTTKKKKEEGKESVVRMQQELSALNLSQEEDRSTTARDASTTTEKEDKVVVVFSGGTAMNCVAPFMTRTNNSKSSSLEEGTSSSRERSGGGGGGELSWSHRVTHVLPVSDDGGSTAEICRVLGGPAVGDIRSRCLRLSDSESEEGKAVNTLLAKRLSLDPKEAKDEWHAIVEGEHLLWENISEPYKNTIRAFLVHFHAQVLRVMDLKFNFSNGSIGNYFFAGARIFFRSLEAAIFLYSRVSGIPEGNEVLPTVCTEGRLTLGAELRDGSVIRGQNEISHPSMCQSPLEPLEVKAGAGAGLRRTTHLEVSKGDDYEMLDSPISRVMYLSYEGMTHEHEIHLEVNPRVASQLEKSSCIVYGMGSLYTSLCPSLILNGVGERISALDDVQKILLINGWHDREIAGYSAMDCLEAVCSSLNRKQSLRRREKEKQKKTTTTTTTTSFGQEENSTVSSGRGRGSGSGAGDKKSNDEGLGYALQHEPSKYVTHVMVPKGGSVYKPEVDKEALLKLGIQVVEVDAQPCDPHSRGGGQVRFDAEALVKAIDQIVSSAPSPSS